jgi:hypothetical protein
MRTGSKARARISLPKSRKKNSWPNVSGVIVLTKTRAVGAGKLLSGSMRWNGAKRPNYKT